ncbi:uncharacterized protein LOC142240066 [Haematobia irritans]|uniref:uncharacterized protein LOC142240066 n=1 Tax=Haematobia irritans TaxID=7368 RepID=UPI003F4FDB0A
MSYHNEEDEETENDGGMLLNLSQKSSIFVADQTPTPTRLIKNCEEVGLFDDLRNVNPFEETFRRACEQNIHNPTSRGNPINQADEESSLHTPQVFPQFDTAVEGGISAGEDLTKQTLNTPIVLDVTVVDNGLESPTSAVKSKPLDPVNNCPKYRPIIEKPPTAISSPNAEGLAFLPSAVQFIQPQLITVTFPGNNNTESFTSPSSVTVKHHTKTHPLILPKLTTNTKDCINNVTSSSSATSTSTSTPHPEPSSASLTPTSQLPIKERLKAILNQSSKSRPPDWPDKNGNCKTSNSQKSSSAPLSHKSSANDTMERRRAASCRYRQKMRNEHKELRKRNTELQNENERLKAKVKHLEDQLKKLQSAALQPVLTSSSIAADVGVPAQLQIPASTIHLVMNIPKIVVPYGSDVNNTQTILKNPLTYRINKRMTHEIPSQTTKGKLLMTIVSVSRMTTYYVLVSNLISQCSSRRHCIDLYIESLLDNFGYLHLDKILILGLIIGLCGVNSLPSSSWNFLSVSAIGTFMGLVCLKALRNKFMHCFCDLSTVTKLHSDHTDNSPVARHTAKYLQSTEEFIDLAGPISITNLNSVFVICCRIKSLKRIMETSSKFHLWSYHYPMKILELIPFPLLELVAFYPLNVLGELHAQLPMLFQTRCKDQTQILCPLDKHKGKMLFDMQDRKIFVRTGKIARFRRFENSTAVCKYINTNTNPTRIEDSWYSRHSNEKAVGVMGQSKQQSQSIPRRTRFEEGEDVLSKIHLDYRETTSRERSLKKAKSFGSVFKVPFWCGGSENVCEQSSQNDQRLKLLETAWTIGISKHCLDHFIFVRAVCGHCKYLVRERFRAATELRGKVKLGALDATVHQNKAAEYGVRGYRTIKYLPAGKKSSSYAQEQVNIVKLTLSNGVNLIRFLLSIADTSTNPSPLHAVLNFDGIPQKFGVNVDDDDGGSGVVCGGGACSLLPMSYPNTSLNLAKNKTVHSPMHTHTSVNFQPSGLRNWKLNSQITTYQRNGPNTSLYEYCLDPELLAQLSDIILAPPSDAYTQMKKRLIDRFSISEEKRIQRLLNDMPIGDKKPSCIEEGRREENFKTLYKKINNCQQAKRLKALTITGACSARIATMTGHHMEKKKQQIFVCCENLQNLKEITKEKKTNNMLTVGGGVCLKTLVAIIVMLSILGQCEMSYYPGLRRRPLQPAQSSSYEVNSDFLTQLMEENARRRLQQQFEQHLELINLKLLRQRQREERMRERYRQQQLAAMAAENEEDYNDYMRKFKDNTDNTLDSDSMASSSSSSSSGGSSSNNNNNLQFVDQYDNTNQDFNYKYPSLENIHNLKDRINFAVNPNDPRYYETIDDNAGGYMVGNMEASNVVAQLRDEDAGAGAGIDDEGVEMDKEEDLDSQVLEEYEEYTPQESTSDGDAKNSVKNSEDPSTMVLSPQQAGLAGQNANTNFYRIKPQSASAAVANNVNVKQVQAGGVAPARQDMTSLLDKLHPKGGNQLPAIDGSNEAHAVMREHLGIKGEMGMYVVALIAGVSAAATVGLCVLGIAWYTFHNKSKAAADVDYPAYGVTGPNKDISPSGDRKLAQSAQMYHYQHQKQQIIAMENRPNNEENCEMSYESDDDNEEGDYTVYECPGLAPTGEMEVKNPLFLDDTPVTPSLGNHPITQVSAQQPSVKKIFEKSQQQHQPSTSAAAACAMSSDERKSKKSKK